ncbi:ABC transporter permease subunit [Nitratireductor luteus]|uniref:ABC transporter permease subunit n=1 Tax=Nitratireductor luteus TaxID=2976980 RepID=UPI0022402632|nr:ATP-binding cassette domain-containing protein [Nitratireductor luteus]
MSISSGYRGHIRRPSVGRGTLGRGHRHPVLKRTRWGLHIIAIGGNLAGAAEVGTKVRPVKIGNFVLCSVLGGLAIPGAFRIGSIDPLAGGTEIMFAAITSAVIGGTLLTGGVGTIVGALLGALVLGILKDGFTLLGVSAYTRPVMVDGNGSEALRAEHISMSFGRVRVLADINLRLGRSKILGPIGDNGAGKSTLMKTFTGNPGRLEASFISTASPSRAARL